MTTKHTAEPWEVTVTGIGADRSRREIASTGCVVPLARIYGGPRNSDVNDANAARIVSCVNACAGIEDPAEAMKLAREALMDGVRRIDNIDKERGDIDHITRRDLEAMDDNFRRALAAMGGGK